MKRIKLPQFHIVHVNKYFISYIRTMHKFNTLYSILPFVLVPSPLEISNLSYNHMYYKLDYSTSNLFRTSKIHQNFNLSYFDLKFYRDYALLIYFQAPLVLLNFEVYNLRYSNFPYCYPVMG